MIGFADRVPVERLLQIVRIHPTTIFLDRTKQSVKPEKTNPEIFAHLTIAIHIDMVDIVLVTRVQKPLTKKRFLSIQKSFLCMAS